ncbi:helix-turn-helix domain-containing protein [Stieleria sp. TO1_6]|uniref:helix-turn-helix domain-containing protein n=1 Tax=Stieleria tagensis TaxID=2956795 RepID=UPI00209B568A|nr:helix-turn-helix domain-containing protein [Stieleria tagensis]MCO8122874.1 helix-turn-helix domain-containing protein [Stieleria tagensis]
MLLTIKEVSERLKISKSKVYAMAAKGDLPSILIGTCRRVLESDLEQFLEERRHDAVKLPSSNSKHF